MRLSDLPRTTSFRLAVLFLALFGTASLLLFGFLYWQTAGYMTREADEWLDRETTHVIASTPERRIKSLEERVMSDPGNRRPFGLFDPNGKLIAGNLTEPPSPLPSLGHPFEFTLTRHGEAMPYRGLARRLDNGELLVGSQNIHEMEEFRETLRKAMAWGGLLVLLLGLAGASMLGAGAVRRIDAVSSAIERIVNGDLSKRLPVRGNENDFDRLVHIVNRMLDDIQRLMVEVKGVSDDIAHDLRTPLTRLLAGLERSRRRGGSIAEYEAAIDQAIAETQDVLATFSALLRIAEIEDGARRTGFAALDFAVIASDATEFYEPLAQAKNVLLSFEVIGEAPVAINGDPSLLFEAIGNLIENAIKFTPSGGTVRVRAGKNETSIFVSIADTGPGIPYSERAAVLRRFHRSEKSRHEPGNGLGLSLVAAIARLHGMALFIEDADPGCEVSLSLPDYLYGG